MKRRGAVGHVFVAACVCGGPCGRSCGEPAHLHKLNGEGFLEEARVPPEEAKVRSCEKRPQALAPRRAPRGDVGCCGAADRLLCAGVAAQREPQAVAAVLREGPPQQAQQAALCGDIRAWKYLHQELQRRWVH